jgi:uncharacterized protein YqjF (DUF2071 family)
MLNYEIDPTVVQRYVPAGTEIDFFHGRTYVSLVGFLFLKTRVKGVPVPFHCNFEEVNLRFYVRHKAADGWRRGVVFIKEIVPRRAIAWLARALYNENYVSLPMRHDIDATQVRYLWRFAGVWSHLAVRRSGEPHHVPAGSEEEFITEHYWGYAAQRDGSTVEYRVEHPPWRIWQVSESQASVSIADLYGPAFVETLSRKPTSAFLAEGSPIVVYASQRLA